MLLTLFSAAALAATIDVAPVVGLGVDAQDDLLDGFALGGAGGIGFGEHLGLEARFLARADRDRDRRVVVEQLSMMTVVETRWDGLGAVSVVYAPVPELRLSAGGGAIHTATSWTPFPPDVGPIRAWRPALDLGATLRVALAEPVALDVGVHHARWREDTFVSRRGLGQTLVTLSPSFRLRG